MEEQSLYEKMHKDDGVHISDVLSCLANLSNDEVFTPPDIVNDMLDMLPQELFTNPNTKFLDPACKTGVFLREIAKRLLVGLEDQIPDLQERIDHIFHNQLYGIAITELTSLLSRRSLYCSKYPNGRYSITKFDNAEGNIRFKRIQHTWQNGTCIYCGANKTNLNRSEDKETYAYEFIHVKDLKELENMKFDVIIGNPPYQLNVGNDGGNSSKARAIYHEFISQAIKLNPRYVCMIVPSRWMTKSTEGISDEWVNSMITSNHFKTIHDFESEKDCFPGVQVTGGINYFLYDSNYEGDCDYYFHCSGNNEVKHRKEKLDAYGSGSVIRDSRTHSILNKLISVEGDYYKNEDDNFSNLVSPKDYFTNKQVLTSSWKGYALKKDHSQNIKYYLNKAIHKIEFGWVSKDIVPKHTESIKLNKVYIPAANGSMEWILGRPFIGEPNSVCSQTYLVIGYDPIKHNLTEEQCKNIITYIKTKFFRYLVSIKKKTQNGPRMVYQFVPLQDFNKAWTDEELYKKYNLSKKEIELIESSIKSMED